MYPIYTNLSCTIVSRPHTQTPAVVQGIGRIAACIALVTNMCTSSGENIPAEISSTLSSMTRGILCTVKRIHRLQSVYYSFQPILISLLCYTFLLVPFCLYGSSLLSPVLITFIVYIVRAYLHRESFLYACLSCTLNNSHKLLDSGNSF